MMIYLVQGTTGEYSDRVEWCVCAYPTRAQAELHQKKLEDFLTRTKGLTGTRLNYEGRVALYAMPEAQALDPGMRIDGWGCDYEVIEVPLRESVP